MLTACSSRRPPEFQVISVDQRDAGAEGIVLDFTVEGTNPNPFELPLRDVHYTLDIAGAPAFTARRSAEATLPRKGTQRFILPAVLPRDAAANNPNPADIPYSLTGTVEYQFPDPLSDVLFDTSIRRPRAAITITGALDFTPAPHQTPQPTTPPTSP